jgi:hypothetical protein
MGPVAAVPGTTVAPPGTLTAGAEAAVTATVPGIAVEAVEAGWSAEYCGVTDGIDAAGSVGGTTACFVVACCAPRLTAVGAATVTEGSGVEAGTLTETWGIGSSETAGKPIADTAGTPT